MVTYVAGNTIKIWVPLVDAAGDPITTAVDGDFTESIDHEATDGTLTAATVGTWTHRGNGRYYATISNAQAGAYSGTIAYAGPPVQPFHWEADVVTAAQADPAAALVAQNLTVDAPLATEADKAVVAGDATTLAWSSTGWPDLTGETATFQAYKTLTDTAVFASAKAVTITNAGAATQNLSLALFGTDTDDFTPGIAYRYEVNSTVGTLVSGTLSAREG